MGTGRRRSLDDFKKTVEQAKVEAEKCKYDPTAADGLFDKQWNLIQWILLRSRDPRLASIWQLKTGTFISHRPWTELVTQKAVESCPKPLAPQLKKKLKEPKGGWDMSLPDVLKVDSIMFVTFVLASLLPLWFDFYGRMTSVPTLSLAQCRTTPSHVIFNSTRRMYPTDFTQPCSSLLIASNQDQHVPTLPSVYDGATCEGFSGSILGSQYIQYNRGKCELVAYIFYYVLAMLFIYMERREKILIGYAVVQGGILRDDIGQGTSKYDMAYKCLNQYGMLLLGVFYFYVVFFLSSVNERHIVFPDDTTALFIAYNKASEEKQYETSVCRGGVLAQTVLLTYGKSFSVAWATALIQAVLFAKSCHAVAAMQRKNYNFIDPDVLMDPEKDEECCYNQIYDCKHKIMYKRLAQNQIITQILEPFLKHVYDHFPAEAKKHGRLGRVLSSASEKKEVPAFTDSATANITKSPPPPMAANPTYDYAREMAVKCLNRLFPSKKVVPV